MRILQIVTCVLLVIALPPAVEAHALLDRAEPRVGSVVSKPPSVIRLTFTGGLEPRFCRVVVTGPSGFGGAGPARPVPGDAASLAVDLHAPVPPGTYTVRWRALSVDTHVTEGDFSFQVRP